ncbi:MAG: hypothetical protein NT090_25400 [Acidobacteria bacterium]|nr:hypothetical protein [Acidobacteriota bacterium]
MAGSTSKKVVISRFDRESVSGFVNPQDYLLTEGVEVLTPLGARAVIPYLEIKTVCFVRDFEESENLRERRLFNSRPKMEGLWVRMSFRDGEVMDGLLANNLLAVDAYGFTVTPPDPSSRHQKVFVPRTALREFAVVGVVGSPLRRQKPKPEVEGQGKLFE